MIANHMTEQTFYTLEPEATFRVPMGTYFAATLAIGGDGTSTLISNPNLAVTKRVSLVMDGRKARPVDVTMPERSAAPVEVSVSAEQSGEIRSMIAGISGDDPGALYTADLGTKKATGLTTLVSALFAKPDGKGGFSGSPYTYQAGWHHTGSFTTGFTEHVKQKELATVRAEYAANTPAAWDGGATPRSSPASSIRSASSCRVFPCRGRVRSTTWATPPGSRSSRRESRGRTSPRSWLSWADRRQPVPPAVRTPSAGTEPFSVSR